MKIFSLFLGELNGVFGKPFLLAGLLPGTLMVFGWKWYRSNDSLEGIVVELAKSAFQDENSLQNAGSLLATVIFILMLGLAFFAARSLLMDFFQGLPGESLADLRKYLARRQVTRRDRILHQADLLMDSYTVLGWAFNENFEKPEYVPSYRTIFDETLVLNASTKARDAMKKAVGNVGQPSSPPNYQIGNNIRKGLELLHDFAKDNYTNSICTNEIKEWQALLTEQRANHLLKLLLDRLHRDWLAERKRLAGFPDVQWMQPTRLGIRAAALGDYAKRRYGIDTSTLLMRLTGVLTNEERKGLAETRLTIEVLINLSASMVLTGLAIFTRNLYEVNFWLSPDLEFHGRNFLFVVVPLSLAVIFYNSAIYSYGAFGEKVVRTVDLYRLKLLKQLGFTAPRTIGEELELWNELSEFFIDGKKLDGARPLNQPEG